MNQLVYKILFVLGAIFILIAAALYGYGLIEDFFAGRRTDILLEQIGIGERNELPSINEDITDEVSIPMAAMYDNLQFSIIGFISIPKIEIMLPVIDRVSDELLKISVCWYGGEMKPEPVRMILTAHNYRSHFGKINELVYDDVVIFKSYAGEIYYYRVTGLEEISADDLEGLVQNEWDLTLLTCTKDGNRRILARCVLEH